MANNEIIKAMEEYNFQHLEVIKGITIKDILALINRQKAKIEGLQDEVVTKTDMLNKQKSEIERLEKADKNKLNF